MVHTITLRKTIESPFFYLPELEMYEGKSVKLTISITSESDNVENDLLPGMFSMSYDDDELKECSFEMT